MSRKEYDRRGEVYVGACCLQHASTASLLPATARLRRPTAANGACGGQGAAASLQAQHERPPRVTHLQAAQRRQRAERRRLEAAGRAPRRGARRRRQLEARNRWVALEQAGLLAGGVTQGQVLQRRELGAWRV